MAFHYSSMQTGRVEKKWKSCPYLVEAGSFRKERDPPAQAYKSTEYMWSALKI